MRKLLLMTLLLTPLAPAEAQTFTPLSGPNNPVPSPICDIINFGFCPQPAPPSSFPDPQADLSPPQPHPPIQPRYVRPPHHRHHRHHPAG